MREADRVKLRKLVLELTDGGQDLDGLPLHKTGLVVRLWELGRNVEATAVEGGAGFSRGAGEGGQVWIISVGRRERLFGEMGQGR